MSDVLDKKIESIRVPSFVNRTPRGVHDLSFWKASEFRNWLFFYSLPCLDGILENKYLQHHSLLVEAIYTLNKAKIPRMELEHCRKLLIQYCSEYAALYGKFEQTFNLHMLLHYVNSVEHILAHCGQQALLHSKMQMEFYELQFMALIILQRN